MMPYMEEVIFAGFGGQGIMLAGKLLAQAALFEKRQVTYMPSYGAEMRGGTAHSMVKISNEEIASPFVSQPGICVVMNRPSLDKFQARLKPSGILVVNSTLAGALSGVKLHIPLAHVEAGLRSYNRDMPEEHNRVVSDHLSDLLFCPTQTAVKNLEREGITKGVHCVGDVMYDSVLYNMRLAEKRSHILKQFNLKPKGYAIATVH